ncbi:unnamed protein product [Rhizoctonia solani]|uniref:Thioredoxin n=1 Tax=Rhizoctonia solani TaxID=456999 RepID=A0A8H3CYK3_9AGAM|nr:unnamed protein product [Rhizoctonia solani]
MGSDKITHFSNKADHDAFVAANNYLTVIDFHATWCGPCLQIAPIYDKLAEEHEDVKFTKVDVDAAPDVAQHYQISAMPTFVFLKDGKEVDRLRGANPPALTAAIAKNKA